MSSADATHDALTGLPNRRELYRVLKEFLQSSRQTGASLAALVIDIDAFGHLNRSCGLQAGDQYLCDLANHLSRDMQPGEFAARYGGEIFCMLMGDVTLECATERAELLRKSVQAMYPPTTDIPPEMRRTISIGAAVCNAQEATSPESIISAAFDLVCKAKRESGGNTVIAEQIFARDTDAGESHI